MYLGHKMYYDFLVVGAGFYGATIAAKLTEAGASVWVIDSKKKAGGNCSTRLEEGIIVHEQGPHIFHTDNKQVWDFVNSYDQFNNYRHTAKVNYNNNIYSFPINLLTLQQVFNIRTPKEAKIYFDKVRFYASQEIGEPKNFEEKAISTVGEKLYELFFYGYTKKQWGTDPSKLPVELFNRLPIRGYF
jgi:UDP-galactopyranose mutase